VFQWNYLILIIIKIKMTIVKRGNKYVLISKSTGKVLGTHPNRASALKQEKAIQISKARKAGHKIPKPKK